jgi:hypothetical protein
MVCSIIQHNKTICPFLESQKFINLISSSHSTTTIRTSGRSMEKLWISNVIFLINSKSHNFTTNVLVTFASVSSSCTHSSEVSPAKCKRLFCCLILCRAQCMGDELVVSWWAVSDLDMLVRKNKIFISDILIRCLLRCAWPPCAEATKTLCSCCDWQHVNTRWSC